MHPNDAAARGIAHGALVANEPGACLARARVTQDIAPGVVARPTGADLGTSRLARGTSAHKARVQVAPVAVASR